MTVRLDLAPDVEAELLAQARLARLPLEEYLQRILRERTRSTASAGLASAAKAQSFEKWARSHRRTVPLPSEALRREHLVRSPE